MLIETPTTTHSPTFYERLTYGDTDQNLRHNLNHIPRPFPCPVQRRRLAAPVTSRAVIAPHVLAIAAAALRRRIPVPTPI
eukprot:scaffold17157_cov58-Phaeocystis_antarctica.AAC.1